MFIFLKKWACVLFHTQVLQLHNECPFRGYCVNAVLNLLLMKNDHSSIEEKYQFEKRNMGQKRWSECLIYWWIRQITRWCVMYTGDCPSILAHTYEWTLCFVWTVSVSSSDLFYWLVHQSTLYLSWVLTDSFTALSFFRKLLSVEWRHIARKFPECVWGSLQSMTDSWDM